MAHKIDFVIATTKRESLNFIDSMNIKTNAIVINQNDKYGISESKEFVMITTPTKGVGINRNIGLNLSDAEYVLIVDDDMIFYDDAISIINTAVEKLTMADVIIFNFDYTKDGKKMRSRISKTKRLHCANCLKYGICCALVKLERIREKNICFSTLFGGGCKYGSGEDSMFYLDCIRNGLKIYKYDTSIGANEYRKSTWFNGYNEKYFYDKGALFAALFGRWGHVLCCFNILRNHNIFLRSDISRREALFCIKMGAKGFRAGITYDMWSNKCN